MRAHDDVLEKIAKRGVQCAFVALVNLDVVSHRSKVLYRTLRLRQDHAGAFAVFGARRVQLLQ